MARPGVVAALTAAVWGCAAPPPGPASPAGAAEVTWELDTPVPEPREGDLAAVVFRIRNGGRNPIVLRDLTLLADPGLGETASAVVSWQSSAPGELKLLTDRGEWAYARKAPGETPPLFNSGLLAPGEVVTLRSKIRLLRLPRTFQLFYFDLSPEEIRQKVYFEATENRETRYRTMLGRELELRLRPEPRESTLSHRVVVFPHADAVRSNARIKTAAVTAALRPRAFTLDQALRKAGLARAAAHTYCASLDGWVVGGGGDWTLVTPAQTLPLPAIAEVHRLFFHVDSLGAGKVEIEPSRERLEKSGFPLAERGWKPLGYRDPREKRTRFALFLPAADLPRFFKDARELGLVLDVVVTPEGGGRIVIR